MRWRRSPRVDGDFDAVAQSVERVATLLSAGVPAHLAWQHSGAETASATPESTAAAVVMQAAAAVGAGRSAASAIVAATESGSGWRVVAAAWMVAEQGGAPAAASLARLSEALRDDAQARREVAAALAGPVASARLVAWLPLVALLFGSLLGFDTLHVLTTSPIGMVCVAAGGLLLWAGARWCARLVHDARAVTSASGLRLELLAIALGGGSSLVGAKAAVDHAVATCGLAGGAEASDRTADSAAAMGAPIGPLLRAEASRQRREARTEASARAARLGVRLLIPLGVCTLPAFVLLGVLPMLIAVVADTVAAT
ncbi:MAG TPA: type II secretion system F family protein [Candidatus Lumbricidophila sp.]|nr:type II secretion system F family protein [Candidatus Lumbricidophila sp.]